LIGKCCAGWAGLVVNGLNMLPLGELDGGRVALGLWGRRAASRISVVLTILLGFASIVDSLALYWVLFVLILQRGPILPSREELSEPEDKVLGIALLTLPLLTLVPYPIDVTAPPF
jgi:membrane-associated protease RseP (regulator of RpoE activity)